MRIKSLTDSGKTTFFLWLEPGDPEDARSLADGFLTARAPQSLDNGETLYTADDEQFHRFSFYMDALSPHWMLSTNDENGVDIFGGKHDPSDIGIKTRVSGRLNKTRTAELLRPVADQLADDERRDREAVASLSPQRDIERKGRKAI